MKCAKCPGTLAPLRQGDLVLDRCGACQGLFFDAGELSKVFSDEDPGTLREEVCALPASADARAAVCPRCAQTMNRVSSTRVPAVSYDVCLGCNAIWLDAGELSVLDGEHTERQERAKDEGPRLRRLAQAVHDHFREELEAVDRLREKGFLAADEADRIRRRILARKEP
jgi:Zn-finger nucleic acid-binding protein